MSPEDARLIRDALSAHKAQIESAHAEAMAAQTLLVGFMRALRGSIPAAILNEAFEEAFLFLASASQKLADDGIPPSGALAAAKITEKLRELVFTQPDHPRQGV